MKRIFNTGMLMRLMGALLLVLAVSVILPQQTKAADTGRYGYQQLENNVQKKIYVKIADALAARQDELDLSGQNCTVDDLLAAEAMVRRDYPEFFYYRRCSYSSTSGGIVQRVEFQYMISGKPVKGNSSELNAACTALDRKVSDIVKGAKGDSYQKALYLHDYVVNNVIYRSSANDQNAYGALIDGKAVCAGYSHAYQLLLREVGIESFYITGTSKGVAHAWLLVLLDGDCYYTDVTWDDPVTQDGTQILGHYYFDMSYEQINKDHQPDAEYKNWLPKKHDHSAMYYFEHDAGVGNGVGKFNSSTAPEMLFKYMKQDGNQYYCEFLYDGADFSGWMNNALQDVASQVGEISISYLTLGEEYILTITANAAQHELKKVAYKAPTCTSEGNREHYECTKCGKRFSDATAKTWLNNDSCVILEKIGHYDGNGDNRCDSCSKTLSNSSATTPTTPPTNATEGTTPPTTNATEATTPVTDATEQTTPATDATEGTDPSVDATEGTQQPTGAPEQTDPSGDAEGDSDADADATQNTTEPTEGETSEGGEQKDIKIYVIAGAPIAAAVLIVGLVAVLRKKKA